MHEMSIAQGILDIALDYAERNNAHEISAISILLGEMSGVETEALSFCFETLIQGTIAQGAQLRLNRVPLMGQCCSCGVKQHIEHYNFVCPICGEPMEIISGRELQVEYIDME